MSQTNTTCKVSSLNVEHQPVGARLRRTATILRVAVEYGWGGVVERLGLSHLVPGLDGLTRGGPDAGAPRLRMALEALGPTFIKLGQLLSVQRDLFPDAYIRELEQLQDHVSTFPTEQAIRVIEAELGQPLSSCFAQFDDSPMAAASIAQVYHATLHDGTAVVVKVQRPSIEAVIKADLEVMFFVARLLDKHVAESRLYNPVGVVEELAQSILRELDFLREADSAERFLDELKNEPNVYVPRIIWTFSSARVLTMEHSPGKRIDPDYPTNSGERKRIADSLMRLLLVQLFENGFFHGDPHPGNVFVLSDGRICFHDFGIIGHLAPRDQDNLRQMFLAVIARDPQWLGEVYLDMGGAVGAIDRAAYFRDMGQALEHYYATYGQGSSFGEVLKQFIWLGGKHQVRLLKQVLLAAKAVMLTEALIRCLDPTFDTIAAFQKHQYRVLKHHILPEMDQASLARSYRRLSTIQQALSDLPITLAQGLRLMQQGELVVRVRHEDFNSLRQHLDRASNRLSFSLLIAAIVIASSLVMSFHTGPHWEGIPLLGLIGYAIAALLGLGWAVAILRSGRL